MEKKYDFKKSEIKWQKYWVENKIFSTRYNENKKPFVIIVPPPNITGHLHMGHAFNSVLQDVLIRFKKLQGYNTLWVPGIDHGGIATQNIVEKILKKDGMTKYNLGREEFLKKVWQWKSCTGDTILNQFKKLGCSLDWDRIAFTMDENCSKAVKKSFIHLFNNGLIYKGKRLVNWCFKCSTALSDIEIEYENERSSLWYVKYPIKNSKEYVVAATTRPETIFGDTAIAVNPSDKRYVKLIGKTVLVPITNKEIKIISDYIVDKSFATGIVKVTPAHDAVDNDIAKRNKLDIIDIISINGTMINVPQRYQGLSIAKAREKIVDELNTRGSLLRTQIHVHSIAKCYRCSTKIEHLMSEQWFLNVEKMSVKAIEVVNNGMISFHPNSWKKPYIAWLKSLKDWCISRQIWWGHRIPIYYCVDENNNKKNCKPIASFDKPIKCFYCNGENFIQDNDVLDTWFSSALWPMSVFNWGKNDSKDNNDLKYFYPTSVLVTGHDILYLWVARMIQFGLEFMNDVPFTDVFIHGIVRDKQGKKMSKSSGNVIDPVTIMEQYGTDALRFALAHIAIPGRDVHISDELFLTARNFVNKIWNAARFVVLNFEKNYNVDINIQPCELVDDWILTEFTNTFLKVKTGYECYNIANSAKEIYDFFWIKYCNWYVEFSKIRMLSANIKIREHVFLMLVYILRCTLQLLSPIMPFITEEIWCILNENINSTKMISENFLFEVKNNTNKETIKKMKIIQDIITNIRTLRSEMNIPSAVKLNAMFNMLKDNQITAVIRENENYIKYLAKIDKIQFYKNIDKVKNSALIVTEHFEIFIYLNGFVNIEIEKARLEKKIFLAEQDIETINLKLNNRDFIKRAPHTEVQKIQIKFNELKLKINKINEALKFLK
ncbi:MAG: valine--tRNA ligase [Endomicrobium sp.]|jgi:valyl-tRNA synthetase|nr:valine--tRNA ligase [Endomicrobium sp.]